MGQGEFGQARSHISITDSSCIIPCPFFFTETL
jgi:hypothetical protein